MSRWIGGQPMRAARKDHLATLPRGRARFRASVRRGHIKVAALAARFARQRGWPQRAQPGDHGDDRDADESQADIFRLQVVLDNGADVRPVERAGELDRPAETRSAAYD